MGDRHEIAVGRASLELWKDEAGGIRFPLVGPLWIVRGGVLLDCGRLLPSTHMHWSKSDQSACGARGPGPQSFAFMELGAMTGSDMHTHLFRFRMLPARPRVPKGGRPEPVDDCLVYKTLRLTSESVRHAKKHADIGGNIYRERVRRLQ